MRYLSQHHLVLALALTACATKPPLAPPKPPEYFITPEVTYISEASGAFEDTVKKALYPVLSAVTEIERAYLINVKYPDGTRGLCLCLTPGSAESMRTAERIGEVFGLIAEQGVHLDIMFIEVDSLQRMRVAPSPFYVRT